LERMGKKVLISFDLDDPSDTKVVMDLINKHVFEMQKSQQKLPGDNPMGGEESSPAFVPATPKQQVLMSKLKIVWDDRTSKDQASFLISEKMNKKDGGV
jgi:hypothetical protein